MENKTKYNIDLYCICYNEVKILPFVVDYWKHFVRHAYVYDNGSDDGTIDFLKQFDWITVRHFDSDGIQEEDYLKVKNHAWKGSDADFVIVCDVDECPFSNRWDVILDFMNRNEIYYLKPSYINVYSYKFPEYTEGKLMHELINDCTIDTWSKTILFNPKYVKEMNYRPGCHVCFPAPGGNVLREDQCFIIHCKHLSPEYETERHNMYEKRLSLFNKIHGYAYHYQNCTIEKTKAQYDNANKIPVNLVIK